MKNDLISREALKAEVALMFGDKTHITESVCGLIDNAPSVYDNPYSDGREDGYIEGYEEAKRECELKGGAE